MAPWVEVHVAVAWQPDSWWQEEMIPFGFS